MTFTPSKRGRAPPATKSVKWQDIPNWYSRTDCPLLQLPGEVLDRIFALETGLGVGRCDATPSNIRFATTSRLLV